MNIEVPRVFIMGIKHSGKSTLGAMLARHVGGTFIDLDDVILQRFSRSRHGLFTSVREVYRTLGPQGFAEIEAEAAGEVSSYPTPREEMQVVALGGGTIENQRAMTHLDASGVFLYLVQQEQILYRRIIAGGIPPFLDCADPAASFHELFLRRDALYRQRADCIVDIVNKNQAESLAAVIQSLER